MKLLAIMGYEETRPMVRRLFEEHRVSMMSSMDIKGCNCEQRGLQAEAWWHADAIVGTYSTLCFAILDDEKAAAIMLELEKKPIAVEKDFPARAFLMHVEKMV